ncbi:MAG: RDD family protein, partial [Candidatus Limnocylindrales bacterium]
GGLVRRPGAIDSTGGELDVVAFAIVLLAQVLVSCGYFAGSWTILRGTPGMRLLGMRVGSEGDGSSVSWRQSLIRWVVLGLPALLASLAVYVPNAIGLILGALGVLWMLALLYTMAQSPTKQGLHDRAARTIVVKARQRAR